MDDIFAVTNSKAESDAVLEFLNQQHPNIKFTIEYEHRNKLSFLDTLVKRVRNRYVTTIYHKKTFTGVYLNWTSLTSKKYKIALIKCLLNRILRICSEEKDRELEIRKLKFNLERNQYPRTVIDQVIDSVMAGETPRPKETSKTTTSKEFIVLPYSSSKCDEFEGRLARMVKKNFPNVDFNVAFQPPMTLGRLFPFKDNIKKDEDKSLVVYQLKCNDCNATYIGKTSRILARRLYEHATRNDSACHEHCVKLGHTIDYENPEVIDSATNDLKLKIKELLHILIRKPVLNKQMNAQNDFNIKTILIKAYAEQHQELVG